MPENKTFAELLTAYLEGRADPGEYLELTRLLKSGIYDEYLKQQIDEFLLHGNDDVKMEPQRAKELLQNILQAERHTEKLIRVRPRIIKTWYWAAAAVFIVALSAALWLPGKMRRNKQLPEIPAAVAGPLPEASGRQYIRLEDGSTILLNKGSSLDYPRSFKGLGKREVTLVGEAYFEIYHDEKKPFIVHAGGLNTTVLGTAFNINAYPGQKEVTVTVTRGKVKVTGPGKDFGTAIRNESISVNTGRNTFARQKVNAGQIANWKQDCFVLDNIRLEDAAVLISNRYHVTISFSHENLKECHISATFLNNENLEQVLTVVTGVINGAYNIQPNDQVIISGKGCI